MSLKVITANWRSSGGQTFKSTVLDLWVSFHSFVFVSGNPYLVLEYCSDVTEGHNLPFGGQNWRSTGGQTTKSTALHLLVSLYRIVVFKNPYLTLEY